MIIVLLETLIFLFANIVTIPNNVNGQCVESYEWYYDSDTNFTCTYEECECIPSGINDTEILECTKYPVTEQSSFSKFKDVCTDVDNAGVK